MQHLPRAQNTCGNGPNGRSLSTCRSSVSVNGRQFRHGHGITRRTLLIVLCSTAMGLDKSTFSFGINGCGYYKENVVVVIVLVSSSSCRWSTLTTVVPAIGMVSRWKRVRWSSRSRHVVYVGIISMRTRLGFVCWWNRVVVGASLHKWTHPNRRTTATT